MGIKSLNVFLREKCPEAFRDVPYSYFKGKRVAVDSDNVLRKLMSRAHKEIVNITDVCSKEPDRNQIVDRWMSHIKDEIVKFMKYGITLIFIFDGKYIDEKSATQLKRRAEKEKRVKDADDMKRKLSEIDELERTPQMVTELRKKMHHLGTITPDEKQNVTQFLKDLGFPVLIATEEGEKLCSMLCIEGKVDAVYSRDTDIVAMGCPLSFSEEAGWVYNKEKQRTELSVKCTVFKPILSTLEIDYHTFVDLCIMAGCDFNNNIFRLGVGTAYKLLKKCESIDNLPEKYDKTILNHERCRQIFGKQVSDEICQSEVCLNLDLDKMKKTDWEEIIPLCDNFPIPSNMFIEKTPSLSSSRICLKIINNVNIEEIPKQKASPPQVTQKMINSLAFQQLQRFKKI